MVFIEHEHYKTSKAYLPSGNIITDELFKWSI